MEARANKILTTLATLWADQHGLDIKEVIIRAKNEKDNTNTINNIINASNY